MQTPSEISYQRLVRTGWMNFRLVNIVTVRRMTTSRITVWLGCVANRTRTTMFQQAGSPRSFCPLFLHARVGEIDHRAVAMTMIASHPVQPGKRPDLKERESRDEDVGQVVDDQVHQDAVIGRQFFFTSKRRANGPSIPSTISAGPAKGTSGSTSPRLQPAWRTSRGPHRMR